MEKRKGDIERWMQGEKEIIYIGGDFNARTGSEGSLGRGMERYSKDRVVNKERRELLQLYEVNGWYLTEIRKGMKMASSRMSERRGLR